MEAVKDLEIKQLVECFMTPGNPFSNREEKTDDDNMSSIINDAYEANTPSISSTVDQILKPDSMTYNTGRQLYKCEECEAEFKGYSGLWHHIRAKHEGIVYSCNQCEYKATQQSDLKKHKKSKHEGVKYSCNQCEYKATTQSHLKRHQKSKHEGVKYSCNQCEYKASQQGNLKVHKQFKHE